MDINIPIKVEIENETFFKDLNLQAEDLVPTLKSIAYGNFPELDDFILKYLRKEQKQMIQVIRSSIALRMGLGVIK